MTLLCWRCSETSLCITMFASSGPSTNTRHDFDNRLHLGHWGQAPISIKKQDAVFHGSVSYQP